MDETDSSTTTAPPPHSSDQAQGNPAQGEHHLTPEPEDFETTCWGCGLHLTVRPYAPAFICSWCRAITNLNATKLDNKYLWWRHLRDRCSVCLLFVFMLFMICGSIWAISPVIFSISYVGGIFHCGLAIILSVTTLWTYYFASFRSPGAPPLIPWGSYPIVGRGGLDNYSFCLYCSKPKSPRSHHCRTCAMCILDMDHHCPFIGNCVGAANHRSFILLLISAVMSTFYVSIVSSYAATQMWPPLELRRPTRLTDFFARNDLVFGTLKDICLAIMRSAPFLSPRGLVIVYLLIASVLVEIGLSILLWQQLFFISEGTTYLSHLSSQGLEDENDGVRGRDFQNLVRFFNFPSSAFRFLPSFWNLRKSHDK